MNEYIFTNGDKYIGGVLDSRRHGWGHRFKSCCAHQKWIKLKYE